MLFPPGAAVCATPVYGSDQTAVIALAIDYSLNAFTSDSGGPWSGPQQIGSEMVGDPVDYNWTVPGRAPGSSPASGSAWSIRKRLPSSFPAVTSG